MDRRVTPKSRAIRDHVRNHIKSQTNATVRTIQDGRTFGEYELSPVLRWTNGDDEVLIPLLTQSHSQRLFDWIAISNTPVVFVLTGEATSDEPMLSDYGLQSIRFDHIYRSSPEESRVLQQINEQKCKPVDFSLDRRARLSHEKCVDDSELNKMGWREFEHCIQNFLLYSIRTSVLLGGTEPGDGVPDGAFTTHYTKSSEQSINDLFIWESKYTDKNMQK